ncbi:hypothetical protein AMS68_002475 [Peltaster fructicola]|uniref:Uncharacterized protein n=1 Tax=Peltaster fructicola TaxID=286661 RepID=A0A6H0XQN9_9PEZI|nr:hypothetical protein AMS68_002475 [Peltaster fructicola]
MVGLPSEERPPGASNDGAYHNERMNGSHGNEQVTAWQGLARHNGEGESDTGERARPSTDLRRPSGGLSGAQQQPQQQQQRRPSGGQQQQRLCGKCGRNLTGQFVRALGDTYHLECFTCHDCGKIVASKFFPVPDHPPNQYPLCETDYFRRLGLLCHDCGGALRGSYITALDRKYHIEHFTCSVCPTVFGAMDSYYEHEGSVFCHYHYSTRFAQKCNGCGTAILKQFVEIFRNGANQHWHPECYMIHKYWNVRLHNDGDVADAEKDLSEQEASEEMRALVKNEEDAVERKVHWIWQTLSTFEERSATCISDMLLHVSNGAYMEGVIAARKFITHVDLLFQAADDLDQRLLNRAARTGRQDPAPGLSYGREAKLLCKKVVSFFSLLADSQDTGVRRLGVTQDLLSLVTGLAHYLKLMIRICLSGALKLERETKDAAGLSDFLAVISKLDDSLEADSLQDLYVSTNAYVDRISDCCAQCGKTVEDRCYKFEERRIHTQCIRCSKCGQQFEDPFTAYWSPSAAKLFCNVHAPDDAYTGGYSTITRLQQYVHLLRVAHARLLATLRTGGALPHTSDDPNLAGYDSRELPGNDLQPPVLLSNTRSHSYAGESGRRGGDDSNTYEDAMGDIKRLRSTRMEKQLSNAGRQARKSRIIGGPEGMRPNSSDGNDPSSRRRTGTFQIVEDRDSNGEPISQLTFGAQDQMTLDDIPRIVQAQQTREQRPNASKYARGHMVPQEPRVKIMNGHSRESSGNMLDTIGAPRGKKYFSELTALEYFVVRHVAVLNMQSLLEGHFNQEELLDLIETKRPTFWSKVGKAFTAKDKKPKGSKNAIFGVPLEQLLERDYEESTDCVGPGSLRVPSLVQEAVSAMKTMDMSVEGVFRKNGNIKRLNDVKAEIDNKGAVEVDLSKENPVQVAALLKKFLRDLPDPLLTYKLHKLFITSQRIDDSETRRRVLHLTCCLLPKAHRDTMEVLFTFMNWVSSFSHVDEESGSKMDIHNLATVITPNILHKGKDDNPVDESFLAIEAVHSLIECNEEMCEVPEDCMMLLNDQMLNSKEQGDITTKEILRRYGELAKVPTASPGVAGDTEQSRSRDTRAPVVTRVNTDPQQAAWQAEATVRTVGARVKD